MGPLTFGSLFTGIGGFDLGLERAGWTCRWQVEVDPFCQRVLAKHWPAVARYGDIRTLDLERIERVDLICGGFPCQSVSVAGKRLAQDDPRWLWPEFARVVRALRPRYVLVENVPGLLVRGLGDVLGDLAALGYDAEWECISAADVGAPHLRNRVWIVGYRQEFGAPRAISDTERDRLRFKRQRDGQQYCEPWAAEPRHDGAEEHVADADNAGREQQWRAFSAGPEHAPVERSSWWRTEPDVGRVAHGIPARVDRLRALGNAIVPQVAEWVGNQLRTRRER
jgi:DNA (cytosine-5)-methyltransferase 1